MEQRIGMAVEQLDLPTVLKNRVLFAVKPIGRELSGFMELLGKFHLDNPLMITSLVWTNQGILDLKQTAEALSRDLRFSATERYKIACAFCLENTIEELWKKIPENRKGAFFLLENCSDLNEQHQLVYFWTYHMKGQGNLIFNSQSLYTGTYTGEQSTNQYAFEFCALNSLETASDYFLRKLSIADREESLRCYGEHLQDQHYHLRHATTEDLDTFFASLSQLTLKRQKFFIETFPRLVCERMIEWPFQGLFVEKAGSLIHFLTDMDYEYLLSKIVRKVKLGHRDLNYLELLQEIWGIGKSFHKRHVFNMFIMDTLLVDLLEVRGVNSAIFILKDATAVEKANILFFRRDIIVILIYNDMWQVLKVLTEHCKASTHLVNQFQIEFLKRDTTSCTKETIEEERRMVLNFYKSLNKIITPKREIIKDYVLRKRFIEKK